MDETRYSARFKGTVDLDQESIEALTLDGLMFFVVAVHVEEVGGTRVDKNGVTIRKDVINVTDARIMLDDARDQAVSFLAGRVQAEVALPILEEQTRHIRELVAATRAEVFPDESEPEIPPPFDSSQEPEVDGVVGSIGDYKKAGLSGGHEDGNGNSRGPKVGKFKAFGQAEEEPSAVESIQSPRRSKDPLLQRFMEGSQ